MSNKQIYEFRRKLSYGFELYAYEILINAYENDSKDPDLPGLSNELLKKVQKKAQDLANHKATELSRECMTADVLVRLVNLLIKKVN